MKNLLQDIWEKYQVDNLATLKGERKILHHQISEKSSALTESLDEFQQKLFEEYNELENQYQNISEKESFFAGIQFATAFLIEAIKS